MYENVLESIYIFYFFILYKKKLIFNSTAEGDSPGTFMTPESLPVSWVQEISTSIPKLIRTTAKELYPSF